MAAAELSEMGEGGQDMKPLDASLQRVVLKQRQSGNSKGKDRLPLNAPNLTKDGFYERNWIEGSNMAHWVQVIATKTDNQSSW